MASLLVVEDGSIVLNANSYNPTVDIKSYASLRGRTLPDDDALIEAYAIRAMDYIESFAEQFKGVRTVGLDQPLEWPRSGAIIDDVEIDDDYMPLQLLRAQNQLVIEQAAGVVLQPTLTLVGRVKRKKTGPLETEWFDSVQSGFQPIIPAVDAFLSPLLNLSSFGLRTLRV